MREKRVVLEVFVDIPRLLSIAGRLDINEDAILDPGAIELRRQDGSLVGFQVAVSTIGGQTVAVLTFDGTEFVGGSLADGSYTLTVRADRVHDRWGRELDGDGNGSAGGNRVDGFFRLFGDSDGDRDVDARDDVCAERAALGKANGVFEVGEC